MSEIREFSDRYLDFLTGELAGINLTRITEPDEFYHKQIYDSLTPLEHSESFNKFLDKDKLLIDIGFGGGFPILPLAFTKPEIQFLGFEARGKKAKAVTRIAEHLNLSNACLFHQRFEDVFFDRDAVITFKAVADIQDLLPKFATNKKLKVYFYKGPNFKELEDINNLGSKWEKIEEIFVKVPDTQGRVLVGFRNTQDVLRRTSTKLSDIIQKVSGD